MIETIWTTASDGVTAGARVAGANGPAIIFVHGVGSTAAIWDYQLEAFAGRYRCFAVELRGNGAASADPAPEHITREGYVEDVLAIAREAGLERFHFVGCSLGGVVGFELLRRIPERIASIAFVGSFAAYPNPRETVENIIAAVCEVGNLGTFARARAARVMLPDAPQRRMDEFVEQMAVKSLLSYCAATKATWTGDFRADLPQISVPSLAICGELDPIAPPALSEEIANGIRGCELKIIPGAGHITNADAPEVFNETLLTFLQRTETAG